MRELTAALLLALARVAAAAEGRPDGGGAGLGDVPPSAPLAPIADRVSLPEALQRALANNPSAEIAAAELRRAAAITEQVRSASLPTAYLNAQDTYLDGTRIFGAGPMAVVASPQNTFTGNVQINVPLLAPQQWVRWIHSKDNEGVAYWSEKDTLRQLTIAVAHAYLSVIGQKRVVEANARARANDEAHYAYVHQRHLGGLGTPLDELRADQQFRSDLTNVESATLGLERNQEALGVLLGVDHPVDTGDPPAFEVPGDPQAAAAQAAELRADLRSLASRREAARKVRRDGWVDYLPSVAGTFQPTYTDPPNFITPQWSWEFIFVATFAIYDGGLRYGVHKEQAELVIEADRNLAQALRQADSDVRIGYRAVLRDDTALRDALQAGALAHQAFDVANLQYKAGATTNLDVIDAERRARDADTAAAVAEDSARQARLDLLAAMGRFP